jgi:uncharacterized protein (TIGR02001 family)
MGQGERRGERSAMLSASWALLLAGCAVPAWATGFDPSGFNVDLAVSSDYVVHGVTRSQGRPIAQARLGWSGESGWMAGAWLSTVDLRPGASATREIDPYLARRWSLGRDWAVSADLTRYLFQPRQPGVRYDYTELRGALSYRDLIDVAVSWAPDYSGYSYWRGPARDRTMLTYEVAAHYPATRWLGLNAGIGRRDLQDVFGTSYWYWSAGTETTFARLSFALTYIGTSYEARELFTSEYTGNRLVATLGLRLR